MLTVASVLINFKNTLDKTFCIYNDQYSVFKIKFFDVNKVTCLCYLSNFKFSLILLNKGCFQFYLLVKSHFLND